MMAKLAAASLKEIEATPQLLDFARALGKRAFADNCAPCHGAGGAGARGYPNLIDNKWLWGGSLAQIEQTIKQRSPRLASKVTATVSSAVAAQDLILPAEAATAIAGLDPREAIAVEFAFQGPQGDVVRTAYIEVGDFAAGRAFLSLAQR